MKSKIKSLVIGVIIGLLAGAVAMAAVFYLAEGAAVDWREYIEGTLIPTVLGVAAAAGVGAITFKPTIDKIVSLVRSAVEKFGKATEDVNSSVRSSAKSEAEAEASLLKIAEFGKALDDVKEAARLAREMAAEAQAEAARSSEEIKEMLRLGFCGMDELVKSGKARRIMKVGTAPEDSAGGVSGGIGDGSKKA